MAEYKTNIEIHDDYVILAGVKLQRNDVVKVTRADWRLMWTKIEKQLTAMGPVGDGALRVVNERRRIFNKLAGRDEDYVGERRRWSGQGGGSESGG